QEVGFLLEDLYPTAKWLLRREQVSGDQDMVEALDDKGPRIAASYGAQPGLRHSVRIGDDGAHFSDHRVEEPRPRAHYVPQRRGDLIKDGRLENFRGAVVVFGRVDDQRRALAQ